MQDGGGGMNDSGELDIPPEAKTFVVCSESQNPVPEAMTDVEARYLINGAYVAFDQDESIAANPSLQRPGIFRHAAYASAHILCVDCGCEFVFSAETQRRTFEVEKKRVDFFPCRCPECASRRSYLRSLKREYDVHSQSVLDTGTLDEKQAMVRTINELKGLLGSLPKKIAERRRQLLNQIAAADVN